MELLARATALVGGAVALMRRMGSPAHQAVGAQPVIPEARKQGIMTLKMPVAKGWVDGHLPTCAAGLKVNAFATGLDHPRWIEVLPNGDVLIAESKEQPAAPKTLMDHAAHLRSVGLDERLIGAPKAERRHGLLVERRDTDDAPNLRDANLLSHSWPRFQTTD